MAEKETEDKAATEGEEGKPEGEGEEGLNPPKKKLGKKALILIAVVAVLVLAGGGAGLYFSGVLGGGHEVAAEGEHGEPAAAHGEAPKADAHGGAKGEEAATHNEDGGAPTFFSLGDILVNLSGDGKRPNFLKIRVVLELADQKDSTAIEALKPRIIDQFQVYLRELRVEDLRGSAGLYRLREELLLRVTEAVQPIRVRDVLFQEMLVQ